MAPSSQELEPSANPERFTTRTLPVERLSLLPDMRVGEVSLFEADVGERLEQFQQKWEPVLRPELRLIKEIEHLR
jgi:hypothetical protein